jgi:hypothetical protein
VECLESVSLIGGKNHVPRGALPRTRGEGVRGPEGFAVTRVGRGYWSYGL